MMLFARVCLVSTVAISLKALKCLKCLKDKSGDGGSFCGEKDLCEGTNVN